jgi:hypothetical protein
VNGGVERIGVIDSTDPFGRIVSSRNAWPPSTVIAGSTGAAPLA